MEPAIRQGATVWGVPAVDCLLTRGNVVSYLDTKNRLVTHRIVAILGHGSSVQYRVCGDFFDCSEVVDKRAVVYKIVRIENPGFTYDLDSAFGNWVTNQVLQNGVYWKYLQWLISRIYFRRG